MTSLHAIFAQNHARIQTATSPSIIKQFYIVKHQKTQNVKAYKVAISKIQNFEFLTLKFKKINCRKILYKIFKKLKFSKNVQNVCHVCIDYICICQISSQSVHKCLSYRPKALKMSIWKKIKFVVWQKYTIQKDENSTIELPVKFCTETMLFYGKNNSLEIFTFFHRELSDSCFKFKLTLTSHLTYFKKS